jgi:hypothetical protein
LKTPLVKVIRPRASDGSLYRCPCCGHATLEARGGDEVCHACYWQDEGQDDLVANEVWGAANGKLSLTEARENFRKCGAYDPRIGREPIGGAKRDPDSETPEESGLTAADLRKRRRPKPAPAAAPKPALDSEGAKQAEEPSYAKVLASLPEAPAPKPPPGPPRPPPVWARPISAEQAIRVGVVLLVLVLGALGIHCVTSGWLTREMLKDHGYYLWAHGEGQYQPKYLEAFAHDPWFRRRYVGQPVDTLHGLFRWLYGGAPCDPDSLRAFNPGHSFPPRKAGSRYGAYWLDSSQRGMTYCAMLEDGKIIDFFFVERQ